MSATNEAMRETLRQIETSAANALANQPSDSEECGRHLNKALGVIELKAHVARWGQEGYPPPRHAGEFAHTASAECADESGAAK